MYARLLAAIPLTLVLATLFACSGAEETAPTPVAQSLIDRMPEAEVRHPVTLAETEPVAWRFGYEDTAGRPGFSAGWRRSEVTDGVWRGTTAAPNAVLELVSDRPLGGGDDLWAVEVRMKASAGEQLRLTVLGEQGPPAPAFMAPDGPAAVYRADLVPGESTTYRLERTRQFGLGPRARRDIRRVVLLPSDEPGAEVEIESVRLVFRQEHLATLETGAGWHGLSEIWMEALASRPGEELVFRVDLPDDPYLDLSVGTVARKPVEMEVQVAVDGVDPVVRRRVVSRPEGWESFPVDLADLGGRSATVTLRTRSDLADAVALWGAPTIRGRGVGPAGPDATAPQGVILFLSDTLRRDHLSLYGHDRETAPFLTRLAREEGVVFDDAVVQGTWTKVSVPSILASQYPRTHGIVDFPDRLPASTTTLAEVFRAAGYATMQTSSVPFSGQLTNLHQGVEELHESASLDDDPTEGSSSKTARPLMDRLLPWITAKQDVPFFALLHTMDAHHPFPPRQPYDIEWGADGALELHKAEEEQVRPHIDNPLLSVFTAPHRTDLEEAGLEPDAWAQRERDWLDGSILAQDSELQRLIAHLEDLGLRDKVLLVFLADHGTELLDHDSHWHGTTVYSELTDVPLVMWGPGFLPEGARIDQPVETIDVLPTLVELAGLEMPESVQGRSLVPLLDAHRDGGDGTAPGWRTQPRFAERENQVPRFDPFYPRRSSAVFDGRWKLIRNESPPPGTPEIQLFDRVADRRETTDLASEHPEVVAELIAKLNRFGVWAEGQRVAAEDEREMTPEELERLKSLGYI